MKYEHLSMASNTSRPPGGRSNIMIRKAGQNPEISLSLFFALNKSRNIKILQKLFHAEPFLLAFDPKSTALVMIDMQRDFVDPGGFGEAFGNDVSLVRGAIEPCMKVLMAARDAKLLVIHTREGHRADLADCPPAKTHAWRRDLHRHRRTACRGRA
jgi:hypothetical protein